MARKLRGNVITMDTTPPLLPPDRRGVRQRHDGREYRLTIYPSDEPHDGAPWSQLASEPDDWYHRFLRYLYLGPARHHKYIWYEDRAIIERLQYMDLTGKPGTIVPMHKPKEIPQAWSDKVEEFNWHQRAQAWDEYQLARERALYEEERRKYREIRLKHLDAAGEAIQKYVEHLQSSDLTSQPSLRQIMSAFNTYSELTRKEFGEDEKTPLISIDARKQVIERIEVIKDYGGEDIIDVD